MKPIWNAVAIVGLLSMQLAVLAQTNSSPLPPVDELLKRVLERVEKEGDNDRSFGEHYAFIRTKVTEFRNSKGELKKSEEKKSVKDPTVVKPGKPVEPAKARRDDDDDADPDTGVSDTNSNVHGRTFEKSDFPLNDELLGRFDFTVSGRETIRGRPALILDFKPANRKLPERNLKDRFINKAAGRVWVDEEEAALVKANLFLTSKVNVVGGLVGSVWRFDYHFNRERTADGLWFPRDSDWHLEGREVFINRTVDYHDERTDVRKVK